MKNLLLTISLFLGFLSFSQTDKEKAISNFESYFTTFTNAYPADKSEYSFKNYVELEPLIEIPKELNKMVNYDSSSFYFSYLYSMKHLNDSLINVETLDFDQVVKDIYSKFKQSIINGEKSGSFNYTEDKDYANALKLAIEKSSIPQIGYYHFATMVVKPSSGNVEEQEIFIVYNNDLEVVDFRVIEE